LAGTRTGSRDDAGVVDCWGVFRCVVFPIAGEDVIDHGVQAAHKRWMGVQLRGAMEDEDAMHALAVSGSLVGAQSRGRGRVTAKAPVRSVEDAVQEGAGFGDGSLEANVDAARERDAHRRTGKRMSTPSKSTASKPRRRKRTAGSEDSEEELSGEEAAVSRSEKSSAKRGKGSPAAKPGRKKRVVRHGSDEGSEGSDGDDGSWQA
jgi:hypothetical protein